MEFATGALGTLLPKLGQLLLDEYNLHKGSKKNIEFLKRELESIQAALRNVGEVPLEQLSELVKIWARDARELSYDMEDIVDTFMVRVQGPDRPSKRSSKRFIKKMKDFVTRAKVQHDIGREIKDIRERVKDLAERRDRYKVDAIAPAKTLIDPRITSLYTKVADLVAIDKASEEVTARLTKGDATSSQQKIVSIVGSGGLGKTTLAKVVHDTLKGKFDCMAFVPVGRNPDLKKVFKEILIDLDNQGYMHLGLEMLDERLLINKIQGFLEKKRYFIVIDDVWDTQTWKIIKLALVENNSESRIIITTRNHEVGREAGEVYKLQPLSDDNSRELFFARIFGGESKSSDHHPDEVSDKILRKCGGIPLAIITMASLLVGKHREEWIEVHRSIGFGNNENQQVENTMKIVSFSYYDLPPHLRTCLLYLSVFPEDYFIEKGSLIWMWIAEGFVMEKKGVSLFEIGEGYFNELVNRSMIQLVEKQKTVYDPPVCGCQVHDMVLDLICRISSEENFVTILSGKKNEEESSSTTHGRVRRLALQNNNSNNNKTVELHMDMEQVRSIICFGYYTYGGVPLSTFKLVRVLSIDGSQGIECSYLEPVQKLLHLRHLRLIGHGMVPVEISGPKFLQTLVVDGNLTSVSSLTQLLCLRIRGVPDGIGKLVSLQELETMISSAEEPETWRRFVKDLGGLRELRVLRIRIDYDYGNGARTLIDMAESLRNLQKLEHLTYLGSVYADPQTLEAEGSTLPRSMRRLFLPRTLFSRFPSFCINHLRLPNLSQLYLRVYYFDEQDLRILGGLPELREIDLFVRSCKEVVCNTATNTADAAGDDCFFPKLRRFFLEVVRLEVETGRGPFFMHSVKALCCWGKAGVARTLIPSIQQLDIEVNPLEMKDHGRDLSLVLQHFASLQNLSVRLLRIVPNLKGREEEEAELLQEVAALLQRAADVHPNRPTLEIKRYVFSSLSAM